MAGTSTAATMQAAVIRSSDLARQRQGRHAADHAAALPTTDLGLEIFAFEITQGGGRGQRLAGGVLQQFLRADPRALPVHVLVRSQPMSPPNSPRAICWSTSGTASRKRVVELRRHDRAQRIRREVAERAHRPVHVLQHALEIVLRLDPRRCSMLEFQASRRLRTARSPVQQLVFQLVAQLDVQRVGEFVRVDADGSALHAGQVRVEIFFRPLGTRDAEMLLEQRPQIASRTRGCGNDHFHEQRLAFFQRHAAVAAHGLIGEFEPAGPRRTWRGRSRAARPASRRTARW